MFLLLAGFSACNKPVSLPSNVSGDGQGISGVLPPKIDSVEPPVDTGRRGMIMTINGSNFENGASVIMAGVVCNSVGGNNSQITCKLEGDVEGPGKVIVQNPSGQSGEFIPPPPPPSGNNGWNGTGTPTWAFVDNSALHVASPDRAQQGSLVSFNSKLYSMWVESGKLHASVYNGNDSAPSWALVEPAGAGGINFNLGFSAATPQLIGFDSKLYAIWVEGTPQGDQMRVAVYNGNDAAPSWKFVDGNAANGLILPGTGNVQSFPRLTVFDNRLFGAFWEQTGSGPLIHLMLYNGIDDNPKWGLMDGVGTKKLGYNLWNRGGRKPFIQGFNSKLYMVWEVPNGSTAILRIAAWDPNDINTWNYVDGANPNNSTAPGLSRAFSGLSENPALAMVSGKLFVTWTENYGSIAPSPAQVFVRMYTPELNNSPWSLIDGNNGLGINANATQVARNARLAAFGDKLIAIWSENSGGSPQVERIHVSMKSTFDNSAWTRLDTSGLNSDPLLSGKGPLVSVSNQKLYCLWREEDASSAGSLKLSVAK